MMVQLHEGECGLQVKNIKVLAVCEREVVWPDMVGADQGLVSICTCCFCVHIARLKCIGCRRLKVFDCVFVVWSD